MHEWLTDAARRRPDHAAVVAGSRRLTYAELHAAAEHRAQRLAAGGVGEGDRVAVALRPGIEFCELLHALPRLGAVLTPLDPREPPSVDATPAVGEHGREGAPTGADAPAAGPAPLRTEVDPEGIHSVVHTSGTSGAPKAVELTYANHRASALASADALGVEASDRWLCPLPVHHVGGLSVPIRCAINATTAVLHDRFDPDRVRVTLEAGEVTLVSLVPTMLSRLREAGLRRAPGLRAVALGGGPIPADLLEWAAETGIPVVPVYGMTETASQVAAGSPGRPLRGVELRIGDGGEILVRGPMVARGAMSADGWLHTGDRGHLDERGLLHVEGRIKEIIVTGGENVAPAEVEQTLLAHPAVVDAAVAGRPDAVWGEAVTACVVLREHASEEELIAWCRGRLAPFKVPKRVQPVPALPRNTAGKLLRDRL